MFFGSENTKNVLIASTYIHLKCNKYVKFTSDLPTVCPRILLSGPAGNAASCFRLICVSAFMYRSQLILMIFGCSFLIGSEIYQETLTKALAKYFGVSLLIVDTILLPGVSFYAT